MVVKAFVGFNVVFQNYIIGILSPFSFAYDMLGHNSSLLFFCFPTH